MSIKKGAFENCSGLITVTIGSSVTRIEGKAFGYCSSLTDVVCYAEQVPEADIYYKTFSGSNISSGTLYVPESAIDAYKATSPWNQFRHIFAIETPTSLHSTNSIDVNGNAKCYNLSGTVVNNSAKGIVIMNGKKMLKR